MIQEGRTDLSRELLTLCSNQKWPLSLRFFQKDVTSPRSPEKSISPLLIVIPFSVGFNCVTAISGLLRQKKIPFFLIETNCTSGFYKAMWLTRLWCVYHITSAGSGFSLLCGTKVMLKWCRNHWVTWTLWIPPWSSSKHGLTPSYLFRCWWGTRAVGEPSNPSWLLAAGMFFLLSVVFRNGVTMKRVTFFLLWKLHKVCASHSVLSLKWCINPFTVCSLCPFLQGEEDIILYGTNTMMTSSKGRWLRTNQLKVSQLIFQRPVHYIETKLSPLTLPGIFFLNLFPMIWQLWLEFKVHTTAQKLIRAFPARVTSVGPSSLLRKRAYLDMSRCVALKIWCYGNTLAWMLLLLQGFLCGSLLLHRVVSGMQHSHNKLAFSLKTLPGRRNWHLQPSGIFLKAEDVFCAWSGSNTRVILLKSKNLDWVFRKEAALCLGKESKAWASHWAVLTPISDVQG